MSDHSYSARVLPGLKAFQRDTVDYVFKRMYEDDPPATKFLVADEVGLGKTMVARGLVARAIDHLREDGVRRIDIVYICSNSGIARQNIRKLNLTGEKVHNLPDRITLLPRDVKNLEHRNLNFVAFTPGTSFNLRSNLGRYEERILLFGLLPPEWVSNRDGALSLLAGDARRSNFVASSDEFWRSGTIDESIKRAFHEALDREEKAAEAATTSALKQRFVALAGRLGKGAVADEDRTERTQLVGRLRSLLASTCIRALEPDLVILDEFQRFKGLLSGTDPAADLARDLFNYTGDDNRRARVLLLSATPYKMYTLRDEAGDDDHFKDFIETVGFLFGDEHRTSAFRSQMQDYRRALFASAEGAGAGLIASRQAIQESLKSVMVRTERLASTPDRGGMLVSRRIELPVEARDVRHYLDVQRVADGVGYGDTLEYWKSAPYILNFMEDYELKAKFKAALEEPKTERSTLDALSAGPAALLSPEDVRAYRAIDPSNARLRSLIAATVGRGTAEWAWVPPSSWYYEPSGRFAQAPSMGFTKHLIFSSWQVVPKVVGALISYEAERQMFGEPADGSFEANTEAARKRRSRRLVFGRRAGRPSGMPVLGLMYPSETLAELGDPLSVSGAQSDTGRPSVKGVVGAVRERIEPLLADLSSGDDSGAEDDSWYWAAPILLDLARHPESTRRWFDQTNLARKWQGDLRSDGVGLPEAIEPADEMERDDNWTAHVELARAVESGALRPGRKPADLADVLAVMAVASPAVVALRALGRAVGVPGTREAAVRNAAGQIAEGFRSLFNQPELTECIRRANAEEPYWRRVLEYCADGCLQAVLDEYVHLVAEAVVGSDTSAGQLAGDITREVVATLTLRAASLHVDFVGQSVDDKGRVRASLDELSFRTGYAVRYGSRVEDGDSADRNRKLQEAFNSPFWPFVMCSTSVGQEGLDFHRYSHAVVHWNMPPNPVDLEQREGRVHRFKGHAVRKNVAMVHGAAAAEAVGGGDPWARMFDAARRACRDSDADLKPYWVYAPDGGARIERHVPTYPLSRDARTADRLRRSLTVYRMAFGQARQEDLVTFLVERLGTEERANAAAAASQIDLSPPESPHRRESGGAVESLKPVPQPDAREAAQGAAASAERSAGSLSRFRDLLDEFLKRHPAEADGEAPAVVRSADLHGLQSLLDEFAGLQRQNTHCTPEALLERIDSLLDAFNDTRGSN